MPMLMPATGRISGTPASINARVAAANRRHRGRAVRFHDLARDADGVGIIFERQHRFDGTFRQRAVADFAAARAGNAAGFADGKIREVVVQNEFLFVLAAGVGIEFLHVVAGAERARA